MGVALGYNLSKRIDDDDMYDMSPAEAARSFLENKSGGEKILLRIESLDKKLNSYEQQLSRATTGSSKRGFQLGDSKLLGIPVDNLTEEQANAIKTASSRLSVMVDSLVNDREKALKSLQLATLSHEVPAAGKNTTSFEKSRGIISSEIALQNVMTKQVDAEIAYVSEIKGILTPEQTKQWTMGALKFSPSSGLLFQRNLLGTSDSFSVQRPKVFVLTFNGDIFASKLKTFREEVNTIILGAKKSRGDSVIIRLNSGGGTVTGYGAAAAQIIRLKEAGIKVTVCVDEVAASGGYMMACVADTIVASPFSMLGSVGVVTTIPNFSERLTREGVTVEDVTAGQYKRTMTPYKKSTKEDREKMQQDVNDILKLFKGFIGQHRPSLNLERIATGEVWTGPDAFKLGLCDRLATFEEVMMELRASGADIFLVECKVKAGPNQLFGMDGSAAGSLLKYVPDSLLLLGARWLENRLLREYQHEDEMDASAAFGIESSTKDMKLKYMAIDLSGKPRL